MLVVLPTYLNTKLCNISVSVSSTLETPQWPLVPVVTTRGRHTRLSPGKERKRDGDADG